MTDDLYGPALSTIHHEAHGALAREAGPRIVELLHAARIRHGLIVDLGCGSGILARYLTSRGFAVLGVERSEAMLRIARRMAPGARFVKSRAEHVRLPRCVAVVATGESITYLTGRQRPPAPIHHHIRRVARALVPGGLFIFDAILRQTTRPMSYRVWRTSTDWAMLADVQEDVVRHVVVRTLTTFVRKRQGYRRSHEVHRVGVYDRAAVLDELRARGFRARTFRGYGGTALPPRRVVFVARLAAK